MATAAMTTATAVTGLTFVRSRSARPTVNALPSLARLLLHHAPGRYRGRATSPSPAGSPYANTEAHRRSR
jgi:hypothetical protein